MSYAADVPHRSRLVRGLRDASMSPPESSRSEVSPRPERDPHALVEHAAGDRPQRRRIVEVLRTVPEPFVPQLRCAGDAEGGGKAPAARNAWVEGAPLGEVATLPPTWPLALLRALVALHRAGWVHGDLSPANVIWRADGRGATLIDFERVLRRGEEPPDDAPLTPGYEAPERRAGWPADPRGDLYSAACIVRRVGRADPALAPLIQRLESPAPSDRGTAAEALVSARSAGVVDVPPPLSFCGATGGGIATGVSGMAEGLERSLAWDAMTSHRLANRIARLSGTDEEFADRLWTAWLPRVTEDPWVPPDVGRVEARAAELDRIAGEAAERGLGALPSALVQAAGALAVTAGELALDEVADALGESRTELRTAVDSLTTCGAVVASAGREPSLPTLRNPSWCRSARRRLKGPGTSELHARVARRLRARAGRDPAIELRAAESFARAGRTDTARRLAFRAAREAVDRGLRALSIRASTFAWSGGIETAQASPPSPERLARTPDAARRCETTIRALAEAGELDTAEKWLAHARGALAEAPGPWLDLAESYVAYYRRDLEASLAAAERGLALATDAEPRARLWIRRATALCARAELDEAGRAAQEAETHFRRASRSRLRGAAAQILGYIAFQRGDFAEAERQWSRTLCRAEEDGNFFLRATARQNLTMVMDRIGRPNEAARLLEEAREIAREHGFVSVEWACLANLGALASSRSDRIGAIRCWRAARDHASRGGRLADALASGSNLIRALVLAGRIPEAEREGRRALAAGRGRTDAPVKERMLLRLQLLDIRVLLRRTAVASEDLLAIEELLGQGDFPHSREHFRILAAAQLLARGAPSAEARDRLGADPEQPELIGWHHLVDARILAAQGRPIAAADRCEGAAERFRVAETMRFGVAFAKLEEFLLVHDADRDRARRALSEAIRLARIDGSAWIEAVARRARSRFDRPTSTPRSDT